MFTNKYRDRHVLLLGLHVVTLYKLDRLLEMTRSCRLNLFCFPDKNTGHSFVLLIYHCNPFREH